MNLPKEFREKMTALLGSEFAAFEASYDKPRRRGLRVNVSKILPEEFEKIAPFPVERIPWLDNGFFYPEDVRPAQHPYYAAGLYYLQEPSAMTPASRLPLEPGDRVLDLCAAPGGKATELAARLTYLDRKIELTEKAAETVSEVSHTDSRTDKEGSDDSSILIANDISQPRAKALLHNLEMTGTTNYCVLNETPERLAKSFPGYFDKILVDAPCSGEGMFRKEEEALRLWSPERVADFARQQKKILEEAYTMLCPGGMLLYSTCTFSPEENEQQIAAFLKQHTDMELQEIEPYEEFAPGRADWIQEKESVGEGCAEAPERVRGCTETPEKDNKCAGLSGDGSERFDYKGTDPLYIFRCVRIWPHKMNGEGHFLALMKKASDEKKGPDSDILKNDNMADSYILKKSNTATGNTKKREREKKQKKGQRKTKNVLRPDSEQTRLLQAFLCDIVGNAAQAEEICKKVEIRQEKAYLPTVPGEKLYGLHVMRGGVYLGDWKKNRFEPSQAWAMTFSGKPNFGETQTDPNSGPVLSPSAEEKHTLVLSAADPRLKKYLAGEAFSVDSCEDGWILVMTEEYPVGWGKVVHGVLKNHYPVSWRIAGIG